MKRKIISEQLLKVRDLVKKPETAMIYTLQVLISVMG